MQNGEKIRSGFVTLQLSADLTWPSGDGSGRFGLKSRGWYGKLKANNGMNNGIFL